MLAASALWIFLSIGAIALFSFLSVMAWVDCRRREREAYYLSEVLKKIADSPEAIKTELREHEGRERRRMLELLKVSGIITALVGIGVGVFLGFLTGMPVAGAGVIPFLVGVALLLYVYVLAPEH